MSLRVFTPGPNTGQSAAHHKGGRASDATALGSHPSSTFVSGKEYSTDHWRPGATSPARTRPRVDGSLPRLWWSRLSADGHPLARTPNWVHFLNKTPPCGHGQRVVGRSREPEALKTGEHKWLRTLFRTSHRRLHCSPRGRFGDLKERHSYPALRKAPK